MLSVGSDSRPSCCRATFLRRPGIASTPTSGSYLGLTLETVSRALSRFAREGLIHFADKGRCDIRIPDVAALDGFVQHCLSPECATLQ